MWCLVIKKIAPQIVEKKITIQRFDFVFSTSFHQQPNGGLGKQVTLKTS